MEIIGHNKILSLLDKSITKNSVSHAYLFSGPEHVGKFTVALDYAKKLVGGSQNISSDLVVVGPEIEEKNKVSKKREIKIETIRKLQHQLGLSAQNGKSKVAIIDDAQMLGKSAQNALLKTLEEPASGNVIILVSQDDRKLLPTIVSRCQKIKFGIVSKASIEKMANGNSDVVFWALGRPGLVAKLRASEEDLTSRMDSGDLLMKIISTGTLEKFALAEEMGKDIEKTVEKLKFWTVILRESFLGRKKLTIDKEKSLMLLEKIEESLKTISETNVNARLTLENLFLNF